MRVYRISAGKSGRIAAARIGVIFSRILESLFVHVQKKGNISVTDKRSSHVKLIGFMISNRVPRRKPVMLRIKNVYVSKENDGVIMV